MKDVYLVNCCRTAVGSFGGSLKDIPAADLGATVVREAMKRANVKPDQVTLIHEMLKREDARRGLATLCIGGGMAVTTLWEKC